MFATSGIGDAAALDAKTGAILWKKHPGGPLRGAPSVANGHVYVVSQDNQLFALKQDTGETVWNQAATLESAGVFGVAAPAAAQGTVVAGFSSGELNAYRYENGRAVWQDALSRTSISTAVASLSDIDADPVIDDGKVYAVGQGGRMVALELVSGQRIWELNIAGISTPWVAGDWLFVVTDDARVLCILRSNGKIRWIRQLPRYRKGKAKNGPISWEGPILAGDRLILASSEGQLLNVNALDGTIGSSAKIGAPVFTAASRGGIDAVHPRQQGRAERLALGCRTAPRGKGRLNAARPGKDGYGEAADRRDRRPAERRQVDAVQPSRRQAPRAGRRSSRRDARPSRRRRDADRPGIPHHRHRGLRG